MTNLAIKEAEFLSQRLDWKVSNIIPSLENRVHLYNTAFPKFAPLRIFNERIEGGWILGNDYRNTSGYYGAYPNAYLKRVMTMFPDKKEILHLFSGKLPAGNYERFDINESSGAEHIGDAHALGELLGPERYDMIIADPPYSIEDAVHYGTTMIKRNTVLHECHKILKPGGHLIWLDQVCPQYSKQNWKWVAWIPIHISTNRRCRASYWFERV